MKGRCTVNVQGEHTKMEGDVQFMYKQGTSI